MDFILPVIVLILVLVWAFRVEIGISKANESLRRLERLLAEKKEKK